MAARIPAEGVALSAQEAAIALVIMRPGLDEMRDGLTPFVADLVAELQRSASTLRSPAEEISATSAAIPPPLVAVAAEWISLQEAADMLDLSPRRLRELRQVGLLVDARRGFVTKASVDAELARRAS